MRRRIAFAVMALAPFVFASCGSDSTEPELDGTMHANIVGSSDPWDAEKTLSASMVNGNLTIEGTENSSVRISVKIFDAAVGTFTKTADALVPEVEATIGDDRSFYYSSAPSGGTATVVITELTATRAKGTFQFFAIRVISEPGDADNYRITNGTFDVALR